MSVVGKSAMARRLHGVAASLLVISMLAPGVVADARVRGSTYTPQGAVVVGPTGPTLDRTIGDNTVFTLGSWTAYGSPFNKGSLVAGTDFVDTIQLSSTQFPTGTILSANWPSTHAGGVYGFWSAQYGNYCGTTPQNPIPSKLVSAVNTLTETHNISISGTLDGFDGVIDWFLTTVSGDCSQKGIEFEVFLHTPSFSASLVNGAVQMGTTTISGITWKVAISGGNDILFMPLNGADVLTGTLDLKAMMTYAISQGRANASWFFNGIAVGIEVNHDNASMTINSSSVTYN